MRRRGIVERQLWIQEPAGASWHLAVSTGDDLRYRVACGRLLDAQLGRIWAADTRSEGPPYNRAHTASEGMGPSRRHRRSR
jgi:hypothetical protein